MSVRATEGEYETFLEEKAAGGFADAGADDRHGPRRHGGGGDAA